MTNPEPEQTTGTYQPWLPDGSPEPYRTDDPAAAAAYKARLDTEADDEPAEQEWEDEWDSEDSARYQDQLEAAGREAGFPQGYRGAGPMFAAVELGDPWYNLAANGETTYTVDLTPRPDPDDPETWAFAEDPGQDAQASGWAFLDRADAEQAADAHTGGQYTRWAGLSGGSEATPAALEAERLRAEAFRGHLAARMSACPDLEAQ